MLRPAWKPLGGFLGPQRDDVFQSLGALVVSALASVVAGLTLASREDQIASFIGLLLFIPAAVGLRGNVFGPFGSRISTAIQTGQFSWSARPDSVLGQNVVAAMVNSFAAGMGLAVVAEVFALAVTDDSAVPLSLADFVVVSMVGGTLASLFVLLAALGLTLASVRFGWDLDNVTAPLVTAAGDLITLPAVVVSTVLIRRGTVTDSVAVGAAVITAVLLALLVRSQLAEAKRAVVESLPVLIGAGSLSLVAGVAIEAAEHRFSWVMLVLLPGYLGTSGALGGILVNRLSTKVHLGLIERSIIPKGTARNDMGFTALLAIPNFVFLALVAQSVASLNGQSSPGLALLIAVVLTGGLAATAFVLAIAYLGTLLVVRFGLDPDNLGIPMVTASLDVVGALTLVGALSLWQVA